MFLVFIINNLLDYRIDVEKLFRIFAHISIVTDKIYCHVYLRIVDSTFGETLTRTREYSL